MYCEYHFKEIRIFLKLSIKFLFIIYRYIEAFLSLKCLDMFTFPDELINSIRTKYPNLIINRDWRSRIARPTAYFSQNSFSLLWND